MPLAASHQRNGNGHPLQILVERHHHHLQPLVLVGGQRQVVVIVKPALERRIPDHHLLHRARQAHRKLGTGKPGQTFTLEFPIGIKRVETEVGCVPCTLTIKGNTVIDIDPPGQRIPLYQREHYRADKAPMIRVNRYEAAR